MRKSTNETKAEFVLVGVVFEKSHIQETGRKTVEHSLGFATNSKIVSNHGLVGGRQDSNLQPIAMSRWLVPIEPRVRRKRRESSSSRDR